MHSLLYPRAIFLRHPCCALLCPILPSLARVCFSLESFFVYQPGENGQIISFFFYPGKKRWYRRTAVDVLEILRNTMDVLGDPGLGCRWPRELTYDPGDGTYDQGCHDLQEVADTRRHDGTSFSPRLRVVLTFRRWWASGDKALAGSSALVSLVPSC